MKTVKKHVGVSGFLFLILVLMVISSCKKDQTKPDPNAEAEKFIYDNTSFWYLWNDYIPSNLNYKSYSNPKDLFEAMMYRTLDYWSFASENYNDILNDFNGVVKTPGYKIMLFKYPSSNNVFGVIEYVYDGGPAATAGLKRGDLILKVNGQILNTTNYNTLLTQDVMQLGIGKISGGQIVDLNSTVSITSVQMNINPVLQYQVINSGGKKIGYLLYDQFIQDYFTNLQAAIVSLNSQSINEMVLDLRYNPGGYVSTCAGLASMLVPSSALNSIFLKYKWNSIATDTLASSEGSNGSDFIMKFPTPAVNLNLSRLIVLTSQRSASASEDIINGLKPYMNVIVIGDTTVGKYTAGSLFYDAKSTTNTWGIYIMISKVANANGETDFVKGFAPDYQIDDDYTTPLGDVNEPLLAKAIEVLTGVPAKKATKSIQFEPFAKWYNNPLEKNGMMIRNIKSVR